ncbi:MAG: DinB family protein [Bryobacteraceae bacterium]
MVEANDQHWAGGREARRIADQLERSWRGPAWHGPSLHEVLKEIDEAKAQRRPLASAHTIWELLLHISTWERASLARVRGQEFTPTDGENFPAPSGSWSEAIAAADRLHDELVAEVKTLADDVLWEPAPGCPYNKYFLLHGVVQHNLYHAGQITILAKD